MIAVRRDGEEVRRIPLDSAVRRRLAILLVLATLQRLWLAWFDHGTNHPDEIFQMLEPAHRFVYGFGIQAWEFRDGARSWFLPGIVALLWKGLATLGLSDPLTVVPLLLLLGVVPNELYSGGMTYLNRDVLLASNPPSEEAWLYLSHAANYAIAPAAATPPAWQPVAQRGEAVLVSRPGGCIMVPEAARPRYTR